MIDIAQLQRGDIIIIKHNGRPYHVVIYAPHPELIGDIIHMGSGFKRSGAVRGTLASMYHLHHGMNKAGNMFGARNKLEVQVFRSKILQGEDIAKQAERWQEQGVIYDEKRLMETVKNNEQHYDTSKEAQTVNVFEYLKFAARRNTAPIKAPFFPNPVTSVSSGFGSFFTAPSLNLPNWAVNFGLRLIHYGTKDNNRAKGFSCAGFVLACIGAVALQDEIGTVTPEGGWVSLKHGKQPENMESAYATAWKCVQEKMQITGELQPGLHTLLSEDQINYFDLDRLIQKLSFLANLHPHHPSIRAFMEGIQCDAGNWEDLGLLNEIKLGASVSPASQSFNKKNYQDEKKQNQQAILTNHQQFGNNYPTSFTKTYSLHFRNKVIAQITGEKISDIVSLQRNCSN